MIISWEKTFGGKKDYLATSTIPAIDGSYIIVGSTYSKEAISVDALVIKIDEDGNKIWEKIFGGQNKDVATSITQAIDGGYVIAGYTYSKGAGNADVWIVKIDENGNKIWEKTFGRQYKDTATAIIQSGKSGYLVVGSTTLKETYTLNSYAWIIKIDENGNKIWKKSFGWEPDVSNCVTSTASKNTYILLKVAKSDLIEMKKINNNGNIFWEKSFKEEYYPDLNSIIQTNDNEYVIIGSKVPRKDSMKEEGNWVILNETDIWIKKVNDKGDIVFSKMFSKNKLDSANSIVITKDNGYLIVGNTRLKGNNNNIWIFKILDCN